MKTEKFCCVREDGGKTLVTKRGGFVEYNYEPKRIETIGAERCLDESYVLTTPSTLSRLSGIIGTENLFAAIRRVYPIASKDPEKKTLNNVHLVLKGEQPFVEACDGFRLCRVYVDTAYGGYGLEKNVPADACAYGSCKKYGYDTLAFFNEGKEFAFFRDDDNPVALSGFINLADYMKTGRLLEDLFRNVAGRVVLLDRKAVKSALANILQVKRQLGAAYRNNGMNIRIEGQQVTFAFEFEDETWDEQLTNVGEDVDIIEQFYINPKYVSDAVNTIDPSCERVQIGFPMSTLQPLFVGNLDDPTQPENLVVPLRKRP